MKLIFVFLIFSHLAYANLDSIRDDNRTLIDHVGGALSSLPNSGSYYKCNVTNISDKICSPVITDYMRDREGQGLSSFFVNENPLEMCSRVKLNSRFYTSPSKLDQFFQKYTHGIVPTFESINKGCFKKLTSLKDQNSAVAYYYYGQMKLLQDGIMSLNSTAAIDKKLGRPILEGINCSDFGRLSKLCFELKSCSLGKKNLSNDISDTKMALSLKESLINSNPKTDGDKLQKERVLGGLSRLYPWIEGKSFKNSYSNNKKDNDEHIANAIEKQLVSTRAKLGERFKNYRKLSLCLENKSKDCDDFHKDLGKLTMAPAVGNNKNFIGIMGQFHQNQQRCIDTQRNIRNNINDISKDFLIASGLTISTMGLGSIAVGSGHLVKGTYTLGALNKGQKIRQSLASFSVQHSNKIKNGAKYLAISLNGAFTTDSVINATKACKKDLSHLSEFKRLTSPGRVPSFCPIENDNPEFQLMSDVKSCAIEVAFASLDFLPAIPYGVAKYRSSKKMNSVENIKYLEQAKNAIDPKKLKLKEMDQKYLREEEGLAQPLEGFKVTDFPDSPRRKTKYLRSAKMRAKFKVNVRGGKLYDSQGRPLNSLDEFGGIFVISKKGDMYFHARPDGGRFHHTTFLAGDDVLSAGEIIIEKGKILSFGDYSGHYKPQQVHAQQGIYTLLKKGADFTDAKLDFGGFLEK